MYKCYIHILMRKRRAALFCAPQTQTSLPSRHHLPVFINVFLALHFKKESALFFYIHYVVVAIICYARRVSLSFQEMDSAQWQFLNATRV